MRVGSREVRFSYTALGFRWRKEFEDRVHEYLYGVDGNLLYERVIVGGNLKEERYYVYLPGRLDRPLAMVVKRGNRLRAYYYIHNHQGSVIALVDREGRIVNRYDYWPDGNMRRIEESVEQPFLYTGAYYDREVGLYYLRARYYSPELRRFIQRDPILFEGDINLYGYTGCDFVNYGDWWGLWSIDIQIGTGLSGIIRFGFANGHIFIEAKIGFGIGAGVMFDPTGKPTFHNSTESLCRGLGVGLGLEGQAYIGPLVPFYGSYYGYAEYNAETRKADFGYNREGILKEIPSLLPKLRLRFGGGFFIGIGGGYIAF